MKPFNLEEAIAGKPLITREGQDVSGFHYFESDKSGWPCIAIVDGRKLAYNKRGSYNGGLGTHLDLFMKPEKVTKYVSLYPSLDTFCIHNTADEAEIDVGPGRLGNKAFKIEYEE